ncbi:LTA synthase family protein [Campylobacter blaseri]|nr:alkaline phosphatase family protein [Campylobacter blaseri]
MSIFRLVFFIHFQEIDELSLYIKDILHMFILGFRLDLTVIGYIQVIPTLLIIFAYFVPKYTKYAEKAVFIVLFALFVIASIILATDFGFYSFFKEHLNIMFFGLYEDDTKALLVTLWKDYPVLLILIFFSIYLYLLYKFGKYIFSKKFQSKRSINPFIFAFVLLALNFIIIRGSFGMFPLGKYLPNVSKHHYINKMSHNGIRTLIEAIKIKKRDTEDKLDYVNLAGFKDIDEAFKIYKDINNIDKNKDNLSSITFKTNKVDDEDYNVVVIMVESFGMPILKYQSEKFDILGKLKKHFDKDLVFTNIVSEGDGTIASLESLVVNIPSRPDSFPLAQSKYAQVSFEFTPAFLFNKQNYNTKFIYGGDLTWRDIGIFLNHQGYDEVLGKINIFNGLEQTLPKDEYFHEWGVYDEYLYEYIFQTLLKTKEKTMIVALSTNNHPPFEIPKNYTKNLEFSKELQENLTSSLEYANKRFTSYAYALDSLGGFLDKFKQSKLKDNTIIVVTADNNTAEGIMKYKEDPYFTAKNIPIYFYLPPKLMKKLNIDSKVPGSQKDIFPTLYNLTLKDEEYISIGANLFDPNAKHIGFNRSLIVRDKNQTFKLNSLKDECKDEAICNYKASIAIADWLVKYFGNKGL